MRADVDTSVIRQRLQDRLEELITTLERQQAGSAPKELDQSRVGRLSRMDAMQQQAMSQAAEMRLRAELTRIKSALERLVSGEYGYCILCDEEIAVKRLEFDPSLPTCIECAEKAEQS